MSIGLQLQGTANVVVKLNVLDDRISARSMKKVFRMAEAGFYFKYSVVVPVK